MSGLAASPVALPARNRTLYVVLYLAYGAVAVRDLSFRAATDSLLPAAALLAVILLLLASDPIVFRRFARYPVVYFPLETALIQALGLLSPHLDVWGLLYTFIAVQARYYLPGAYLVAWGGAASVLLTVTLMATNAPVVGLGLAITYVADAVLIVSWDVYSSQAEAARRESDRLLDDLQHAHRQLQAYAEEVEAQAATRERDRLANQLHDSVGQTIFGIALSAESVRLLLAREPARVPAELERLQELTSGALAQMRSLIAQWRPR